MPNNTERKILGESYSEAGFSKHMNKFGIVFKS